MIDLDFTVIIQCANFLITLIVLNVLLIRPVRDMIAKRRAIMASFAAETAQLDTRGKKALDEYEAALDEARAESAKMTAVARDEGQKEAGIVTGNAQLQARAILQEATKTAKAETEATRVAISSEMQTLVAAAFAKLVPSGK